MTTKTEYLTGQKPERYKELLEPLVSIRIDDMSELLMKLRSEAKDIEWGTPEYKEAISRYRDVEKAIHWWIRLEKEGTENYE